MTNNVLTENEIFQSAALFSTKRYGPLYLVNKECEHRQTFHVYLLEDGHGVVDSKYFGPNHKIFGIVAGRYAQTDVYGWMRGHPQVQNGKAMHLLTQLVQANICARQLGMHDHDERQQWLASWAQQHLLASAVQGALPMLELPDMGLHSSMP